MDPAEQVMSQREEFDSCAERLRALADPVRLRIVLELFRGPRSVGDLCDVLGEEMVKVSHHLGILRRIGILAASRCGRNVLYAIEPRVNTLAERRRIDFGCCRIDLVQGVPDHCSGHAP